MTSPFLQSVRAKRRAFSLMELLVAIEIIMILIALVLHGTSIVRQISRGLLCLINQREIMGGWVINPCNPTWVYKLMVTDHGYFNLAFVDGHTERYKWAGTSYTVDMPIEEALAQPQTYVWYPGPDYEWVAARLFPGSRALYGDW